MSSAAPAGDPRREGWSTEARLGCIAASLVSLCLVSPFCLSNLVSWKGSAEAQAIGVLRAVKLEWQAGASGGTPIDVTAALDRHRPHDEGIVAWWSSAGHRPAYRFEVVHPAADRWGVVASPVTPGKTGDRWFLLDDRGSIRFSTTGTPTSTAVVLGG